jgi:hypothetical protein
MVTYLNDTNSLSVYNGTAFTTDRTIQVFANAAARSSAIPSPVEGMLTWLEDVDRYESYTTSWVELITPGAWRSFTPTFSNFTLGNGTVVARYAQIGKTVHFYVQVTLGSTSSVTGSIAINAPVAKNSNMGAPIGQAFFQDSGTAFQTAGYLQSSPGSNVFEAFAFLANLTYLQSAITSATIPFTWANTDLFGFRGTYEVA